MTRRPRVAAAAGAMASLAGGCDRPAPAPRPDVPAPWFEPAGTIDFVYQSGHRDRYLLPEIMGGGAALFDMDGDGDLDAYLVQGGRLDQPPDRQPPNHLYRNDGTGRFDDVTPGSGAEAWGYGMGAATGDYDGDGDLDVYVTNCGPNVLLRNDGGGRFTDVTAAAGVGHPGWSTAAVFFDADADGDLDLFVANYLAWSLESELDCYSDITGGPDYCSPGTYKAPATDVLYVNRGDGTFADGSDAAGIAGVPGTGLGAVAADFTGDGAPDVFVANDGMPDRLWVNDGHGRFTDQGLARGCAVDEDGKPKAGMGVAAVDIDDDGDLDLLVGNIRSETDSLHRNLGGGVFADATAACGLSVTSRPFTRFGLALADFDQDGWLDLYQANGRVMRAEGEYGADPFAEPNLLFSGGPDGRFHEVQPRGGTAAPLIATSRAAAFGDVDGDGDVDVLVVNRDAPATLLRNRAARGGWIMFRVLDRHGADALGAAVRMTVGPRTITRQVRTAGSYLSAGDPRIHVGLGDAAGVTGVVVTWPDGTRRELGDLAAGRVYVVKE